MTAAKALEFGSASWTQDVLDKEAGTEIVQDLYERERASLHRYLSFLGVDTATAEDTVQESFLRLYQHVMRGGDRSNLRAWLYRVGHNLTRNTQQAFRNSRTGPIEDAPGLADRQASFVSAEQALIEREDQQQLARAIGRLKRGSTLLPSSTRARL